MDYNKVPQNRPVQPIQQVAQAPRQFTPQTNQNQDPGKKSNWKRIVLVLGLVLLVLSLFIATLLFVLLGKDEKETIVSGIEADKYQAVFMTNGQVYFGKLDKLEAPYSELTDVYYLQVQQDVQPAAEKPASDKSQVSLTKLGNELHGPTDRMHIASDQILFWENLKQDSTVVKAIKEYKTKRQ